MTKVNKSGSRKRETNTPKSSDTAPHRGGSGNGAGKGPSRSPAALRQSSGDAGKGPMKSPTESSRGGSDAGKGRLQPPSVPRKGDSDLEKGSLQPPTESGGGDVGKGSVKSPAGKRRVGGTAVAGAKSTQPREVKSTSPAQQQTENYNRDTRRRMQHLGTGPYSENPVTAAQEKRQKRIDRRKKRVEERREEAKKAIGSRFKVSLGRGNTYFLIAIVAIIVIVIVVAIIINHPFSR